MNNALHVDIERMESEPNMGTAVNSPDSLFVWWELPASKRAEIENNMGASVKWCLRVTDRDLDEERLVDIEAEAGNYYLDLHPEGRCRVELGWHAAGEFHTICGPMEVVMPSDSPAEADEAEWVDLKTAGNVEGEEAVASELKQKQRAGLEWDEELLEQGASGELSSSGVHAGGNGEQESGAGGMGDPEEEDK